MIWNDRSALSSTLLSCHGPVWMGLLVVFTAAYNIKVLASEVSVDRYALHRVACKIWRWIVHLVLKNKQLFKEMKVNSLHFKKVSNFNFQSPPFEKRTALTFLERGGRPMASFKFDIDSEVRFIYPLIPRKSDFLGWLAVFYITPITRFLGLLVAFTAAYNIKVPVSGYQSIYMHCVVMSVEFDDGLSTFVLRNKQLFKKWRSIIPLE
jgi:hypothetical protein